MYLHLATNFYEIINCLAYNFIACINMFTIITANSNNIGDLKLPWSISWAVLEGRYTHRQHHLAKDWVVMVHQIFWSVKLNHLKINNNLSYST